MISTDRLIFNEDNVVRARQAEYAKQWSEMHIVVFTGTGFSEQSIGPNCWIYPTNSFTQLMYSLDAIRLGKFISRRRGITHVTCQDPFLTGMVGVHLKKSLGLNLELQLHTDIASPKFNHSVPNGIRKFLALSYLPKADSIRVVSNRIKEYLVKKLAIDENKIYVKPIPVDIEWIRKAPITAAGI